MTDRIPPLIEEVHRIRRSVRLALYGCLIALVTALALAIGNVAYSNHLDGRQRAEAARAVAARSEAAERSRFVVCRVAIEQAEALTEATGAGIKARQAWIDLQAEFHCNP
jgi:hypothetical protein